MQKTYNVYDNVVAETFAKLKGSAWQISTVENQTKRSVVDAYDLVVPPLLENAVFITTSMETTREIANTTCAAPRGDFFCNATNVTEACPKDEFVVSYDASNGNEGLFTGKCDYYDPKDDSKGMCEILGWCPDESRAKEKVIYDGIGNWSLLVRLNAEFALFDKKFNTAEKNIQPGLNQWMIKDILHEADTEYESINSTGAILLMKAKYDCDFNTQDTCTPDWEFSRLDKTSTAKQFSEGFSYYQKVEINETVRVIHKRYGLKLEMTVSGQGGRFDLVQLTIALGSGIGLLSVASLVTDFILQNICKSKRYLAHKYDNIVAGRVSTKRGDYDPPLLAKNESKSSVSGGHL